MFNGLVWLYQTIPLHDLGIAIILLTIIIRIALYPIFKKVLVQQKMTQEIQPEMKAIQKKYAKDQEAQAKAMMALYAEKKFNPLSSIFWLFAQMPILLGIFMVTRDVGMGTAPLATALYSFITAPLTLSASFVGILDLSKASILLAIIAAAVQYVQSVMALPKAKEGQVMSDTEKMTRNMTYIAPAITLIFLVNIPAAVGLYWITSSFFSIIQQYIINKTR